MANTVRQQGTDDGRTRVGDLPCDQSVTLTVDYQTFALAIIAATHLLSSTPPHLRDRDKTGGDGRFEHSQEESTDHETGKVVGGSTDGGACTPCKPELSFLVLRLVERTYSQTS